MIRWLEQFRGLVMASALLAIILIASANGFLTFFNGPAYDHMSGVQVRAAQAQKSPVLLIDVPLIAFHTDSELWINLLAVLQPMQSRQIALLEAPQALSESAMAALGKPGIVSVGASVDDARLVAPMPIADNGVFRRISSVSHDSHERNLLEWLITRHQQTPYPADEIYPNFLAGGNHPPRIPAARFISGEIPGRLVRDRIVIIAPLPAATAPDLFTPAGAEAVTDTAGFHTLALHSVLTNSYLLKFPLLNLAGMLVVLAIGCLYFYQRVNLRLAIQFTAVSSIVVLGLTFALLHYAYVMFPLTETLCTIFGMWVTVLNRKYVAEQQGMLLELNNISRLMRKRLIPEDLLQSEQYWADIGGMIQQLLRLERSIFLETLPGQRRLQEIHALNCDLSVIDERRRDYERTPYTTALRARAPIRVEHYLKDSPAADAQYLTALQVEGEVLGFWAFTLRTPVQQEEETLRVANRLAGDIAQLLQQRKQIHSRTRRERRRWHDYLALQGGRSLAGDLKDALHVTTQRLRVIEDLFDASETALFLYDPFGQLLLENPAAASLCSLFDIDAYGQSYAGTLASLTGLSPDAARDRLQQVFFSDSRITLPIQDSKRDIVGTVSVTTLDEEQGAETTAAGGSALQHRGVLLEVRLGQQAANALPDWIGQLLAALAHAPRPALSAAAHQYLTQLEPELQPNELPTIQQCLKTVEPRIAMRMRRKRVQLKLDLQANPQLLYPKVHLPAVLEAMLDFAVSDAKRGSTIQIELIAHESLAMLSIRTDGIGVVNGSTAINSGAVQPDQLQDAKLSQAATLLERYAAQMHITSEVGAGCEIVLEVPALTSVDDA